MFLSSPHPQVQCSDLKDNSVRDTVPPHLSISPTALDRDTHLGPGGEECCSHLPVSGPPLMGKHRELGGREG